MMLDNRNSVYVRVCLCVCKFLVERAGRGVDRKSCQVRVHFLLVLLYKKIIQSPFLFPSTPIKDEKTNTRTFN